MYGTCGRIDNKADFDFFDFDIFSSVVALKLEVFQNNYSGENWPYFKFLPDIV